MTRHRPPGTSRRSHRAPISGSTTGRSSDRFPTTAPARYSRTMSEPLTAIRNIGPAMAAAFESVGIRTAEDLRALGTDAAYARLLESGHRPHFIGYYVIEMGLQGRPWNDCKGAEKAALRDRFDALKARSWNKGLSELEAALDALGVVDRRSRP